MEWQPIESAPKDGRELIVSGFIFDDPSEKERWVTMAFCFEDVWYQSIDFELYTPTHWMPMPDAPPSN